MRKLLTASVCALLIHTTMLLPSSAMAEDLTDPPPAMVTQTVNGMHKLGEGTYRWFGLHVYDAQLWSAATGKTFDYKTDPSWLELRYARDFDGAKIAEKSREEIEDMNDKLSDKTLDAWEKKLADIFPDIKEDDSLSAFYSPGKGIQFFKNGKKLDHLNDEALSVAFMAIWLDPNTSAPWLRRELMGLSD